MAESNAVRTFFSPSRRRLRRRGPAAGGRKRPSSPDPAVATRDREGVDTTEPRPLMPECQATARRVKVAAASLRDRASSNLDPPDAGQVWQL